MALAVAQPPVHHLRDERIERLLDESGVHWTFIPKLSLAAIDRKKSLSNQARVGAAVNADQVEVYAEAYRRGEEFPALVVCSSSSSPLLVVADGNHRLQAADLAKVREHGAYLVETPTSLQFLALTYRLNVVARHGLALSLTDRLHHAAHLVSVAGLTRGAAADVMGVSDKRLTDWMLQKEAENRVRRLGLPVPTRSSDLYRMSSVRSDVVLGELAKAAPSMRAEEFSALVSAANRARSEQEAVDKVRAVASVRKEERAGLPSTSTAPSPYAALSLIANRLGKLPTRQVVESIPVKLQPGLRARLMDRVSALEEVASWLAQDQ